MSNSKDPLPDYNKELRELCDIAHTLLKDATPWRCLPGQWRDAFKRWQDRWVEVKSHPAPPVTVSQATHVHPPLSLIDTVPMFGLPGTRVPLPPDTEQTLKFDAQGSWRYVPTVNKTPSGVPVQMFPTVIEFSSIGAMRCSQYQSLKGVTSMKLQQGQYCDWSFCVGYDDGSYTLVEVKPGMKVQMYLHPKIERWMLRVS